MASASVDNSDALPDQLVEDLKLFLWGSDIKHEVFRRWTQGVVFSEEEPSALVQHEGGPCAVIAPLQAFLLKNLLFRGTSEGDWRQISADQQNSLLCSALEDIFLQLLCDSFILVSFHDKNSGKSSQSPENTDVSEGQAEESTSSPKKQCFSNEQFHSGLRCKKCSGQEELVNNLKEMPDTFRGDFGVLLVLYSMVLSKGIEQIKNEVEDPGEALIDGTYGHGSQSLINLLLTGSGVSNVWDNDKDVSGLKLRGITAQATVGFLTLLEHLRYCEVGWYYKNPVYPVWLLGSETHLTVLFSPEKTIVGQETGDATARRMFNSFDKDSCGFIMADVLGDLMAALDLVSEPEYVKIMCDKLDPEQLGIITLNVFMEEFYPSDHQEDTVQTFPLYHYNGIPRSCPTNKVLYVGGTGVLKETPELQIITDSSPIKTCLMTKWPTIELKWDNDVIPSLN